MKKITTKIKPVGKGLIHDSRKDVQILANQINHLTEKINEIVDKVNLLDAGNRGGNHER